MSDEKICTHIYLTKCKGNVQPPGFADYLRGTIALYLLSKEYGYKLLLDNSHPIFKYIEPTSSHTTATSTDIIELNSLSNTYEEIYDTLPMIFSKGDSFTIMTNSFYTLGRSWWGKICNWGDVPDDCIQYLKHNFSPSKELSKKVESILSDVYNIKKEDEFIVIHLRLGDKFIHTDTFDENIYSLYYNKINDFVNGDTSVKYVLLSDSSAIASKLHQNIVELEYWSNNKIHLGDLINTRDTSVLDTLTDFFILSRSREILTNGSGFSTIASLIFNIPCHIIF
jgi:hypothetical protein